MRAVVFAVTGLVVGACLLLAYHLISKTPTSAVDKAVIQPLNAEIKVLQGELSSERDTSTSLKNELALTNSTLEQKLRELGELADKHNALTAEHSQQTALVGELRGKLDENSKTIEEFRAKVADLEQKLSLKTEEAHQKAIRISQLEQEISQAKESGAKGQDELSLTQAKLATTTDELSAARAEIARLSDAKASLEAGLADARTQMAELASVLAPMFEYHYRHKAVSSQAAGLIALYTKVLSGWINRQEWMDYLERMNVACDTSIEKGNALLSCIRAFSKVSTEVKEQFSREAVAIEKTVSSVRLLKNAIMSFREIQAGDFSVFPMTSWKIDDIEIEEGDLVFVKVSGTFHYRQAYTDGQQTRWLSESIDPRYGSGKFWEYRVIEQYGTGALLMKIGYGEASPAHTYEQLRCHIATNAGRPRFFMNCRDGHQSTGSCNISIVVLPGKPVRQCLEAAVRVIKQEY